MRKTCDKIGMIFSAIILFSYLPSEVSAAPRRDAPPKSSKGQFRIAENGKALTAVSTLRNASPRTLLAADELAKYLGEIAGCEFKRVKNAEHASNGIIVASIDQFPPDALKDIRAELAEKSPYDNREAFVIRSAPDRLLLVGATEKGASHAVYRLLKRLGCRWFFPSPEWEIVPRSKNLAVDINLSDRPAILARRIWYQWGFFDRGKGKCRADYENWARRNLMDSSFSVNCSHAWQVVIRQNKKLFKEHPEYLALRKTGKKDENGDPALERGGAKLCVSNPEVLKLCEKYVDRHFAENPEADMVSMEASDGGGFCECAKCAKLGSVSNQVFGLADKVAEYVAKKYPGKLVGALAYADHSEPPSFKLAPNIYVELTGGFTRGRYTYDELLELWPKKVSNMGFYEYFSVFQWNWDKIPGGHGADVAYLTKRLRGLAARNARSVTAESGNNWGLHGRGYVLANRLMWDPKTDPDAVLEDFYEKAFGPAAKVMRRYYERISPENVTMVTKNLLAGAFRDLREAAKLAEGDKRIQARVDDLKIYLRYNHLRWLYDHAKNESDRKKYAEQLITHVYRSRYTYMNHWEAIRQFWVRKMAKKFNVPEWNGKKAPWIGLKPYTHEEIDKFFQDGLAYFKPVEVKRTRFSRKLVVVELSKAKPYLIDGLGGGWQGKMTQAIGSVCGEPLKVGVRTGIIAWYRNRAKAFYEFTTQSGETLLKGRLPLDGNIHRLVCRVPSAGVYLLTISDSSAWKIHTDSTLPLAVILPNKRSHSGSNNPFYFYVPKGVEKVQYFWIGRGHKVVAPNGKTVREVRDDESGDLISIPVPKGLDGKLWKLTDFTLGKMDFLNVPNLLFHSNQTIILPADLARKDYTPASPPAVFCSPGVPLQLSP